MTRLRTLIVEDDFAVAHVARGFVERHLHFEVVDVATTGADGSACASRAPPGCDAPRHLPSGHAGNGGSREGTGSGIGCRRHRRDGRPRPGDRASGASGRGFITTSSSRSACRPSTSASTRCGARMNATSPCSTRKSWTRRPSIRSCIETHSPQRGSARGSPRSRSNWLPGRSNSRRRPVSAGTLAETLGHVTGQCPPVPRAHGGCRARRARTGIRPDRASPGAVLNANVAQGRVARAIKHVGRPRRRPTRWAAAS